MILTPDIIQGLGLNDSVRLVEKFNNGRGLSDVYKLLCTQGAFVAKKARDNVVSPISEVEFGIALMTNGFYDFAQSLRVYYDTNFGGFWTLYPLIYGIPLDARSIGNVVAELGAVLSSFHAASSVVAKSFLSSPVRALIDADANEIIRARGGELCIIHGDLRDDNIIIEDSSRLILIDFEFRSLGYPALDIASLRITMLNRDGYSVMSDEAFSDIIDAYSTRAKDETLRKLCESADFDIVIASYYDTISLQIAEKDLALADVCVAISKFFRKRRH